ncbi:MAG: hypothetical protein ABGW77_02390 [Campylobacterales bacterium]
MGSSKPDYHQWQVIFVHFGFYWEELEERLYTKEELKNGVNVGREFSEPHMAIILSPNPLCKGDTLLVVPITNYTDGDEYRWDKIVIHPKRSEEQKVACGEKRLLCEPFLQKKSSIHLSAIRMISKRRIICSIYPYITKRCQREIGTRVASFLGISKKQKEQK